MHGDSSKKHHYAVTPDCTLHRQPPSEAFLFTTVFVVLVGEDAAL
jgi:hypothetical protein